MNPNIDPDKMQEYLLDATGKCEDCGEIRPLLAGLCEECYG